MKKKKYLIILKPLDYFEEQFDVMAKNKKQAKEKAELKMKVECLDLDYYISDIKELK